MKVLHVDINGWVYGVQKYVINFCKQLNKIQGYQTIVVGPSGEYLNKLREGNINVVPVRERWKNVETDPKAWIRLYRIIRREMPDVIHSHSTKENIISKIIGKLLNIPVIPVYHCMHRVDDRTDVLIGMKRKIYEKIYLDILERVTSRFSVRNIAVSHSVKNNIRRFGVPNERIQVIYSGINGDVFKPRKSDFNKSKSKVKILSISRIDENKGIFDLIEAAKIIKGIGCDFEINLGGDGPLIKEAKELVVRAMLIQEVKFLGYVENIQELQTKSDIFVLASYSEGLPLSIMEAMGMALPVVATNVGGIPEIITHGKNGLVTPHKNPGALAHNLLTLIQDPHLRNRYGHEARQTILQEFEIHKMIDSIINLYSSLFSKRRS